MFQEIINILWQIFAPYRYLGVFTVSFIGTASIVIPIPYTLLIFTLCVGPTAAEWDPILLIIASGLGSAIGEMSGYCLGYFGRKAISQERQRKMSYLTKIFDRYGPIAIFIFALSPLPDDLLYIPLGILKYKFYKAFIPTIIGKFLMIFIIVYFSKTAGNIIRLLFGEGGAEIVIAVTTVLLFIVIIAMYRIDWEAVFKNHVFKEG